MEQTPRRRSRWIQHRQLSKTSQRDTPAQIDLYFFSFNKKFNITFSPTKFGFSIFTVRGQKVEVSFWRWEIPNSAGRSYCSLGGDSFVYLHCQHSHGKTSTFSPRLKAIRFCHLIWYYNHDYNTTVCYFRPITRKLPKIYCGEKTREKTGNSKIGLITYTFRAQIIISQQRN